MARLVLRGGRRLAGEVQVSGARNAALPILASSLLGDGNSLFSNVPDVEDVRIMARLLACVGASVEARGTHVWRVFVDGKLRNERGPEVPYEAVRALRSSLLLLGPLLARHGRARVALPGWSLRGVRPVDEHLRGLSEMGATFALERGDLVAHAARLRGASLRLAMPTVTGTESVMMAATLAQGRTQLGNAAREPEVQELAWVLNKRGARIEGAGTSTITIEGVDELLPVEHTMPPDRIEAGTWLVAGALAGDGVRVVGALPDQLEAVLSKLRHAGAAITAEGGGLRISAPSELLPIDLSTAPYPGFPTDMQAQFMVLAACARGQSVITETIFANRWAHVAELRRLGADVIVDGQTAVVRGPGRLQGARVEACDARAAVSLVLAGLVADGETIVENAALLERAYEGIARKLAILGADVECVPS